MILWKKPAWWNQALTFYKDDLYQTSSSAKLLARWKLKMTMASREWFWAMIRRNSATRPRTIHPEDLGRRLGCCPHGFIKLFPWNGHDAIKSPTSCCSDFQKTGPNSKLLVFSPTKIWMNIPFVPNFEHTPILVGWVLNFGETFDVHILNGRTNSSIVAGSCEISEALNF